MNKNTLITALAAALCFTATAQAAEWPERTVRIVVPYGPGGAVDVATRKMAQKLGEQTGQTFVVENKPGATGTIGATQVARSQADGYTLMANDTTYSLLPAIFNKLPFDPATDLQPVAAFIFAPMALAVRGDAPVKTLDDLIQKAKAAPGDVTYGSGGTGTTPHFAAEGFGLATGTKLMHVPFKGAAEATQAVMGNVVDFQFASTTGVMGAVKGGNLRLLAVSGQQRLPVLADVPTFAEAGVQDVGVVNWTGLWAPKGTPPAVLERLQKEVAIAMASPDMQAFAQGMGADPRQADAQEFTQILRDSAAMWKSVGEKIGYEAQ